jgi:hypothetical protein
VTQSLQPYRGSYLMPAFEKASADGQARRLLTGTLLGSAPFTIPPHRAQGTLTLGDRGCNYRGAPRLTAGEAVLDTVNRTAASFEFITGRLDRAAMDARVPRKEIGDAGWRLRGRRLRFVSHPASIARRNHAMRAGVGADGAPRERA